MALSGLNKDVRAKIEKLYTLSLRGVGGEKVAAEKHLLAFLKKYGINIEDLNQDTLNTYSFGYKTVIDRQLLVQIAYSVLGDCYKAQVLRVTKNTFYMGLSASDYADIKIRYSIYRRAYKEAEKDLYESFLMANDIYPKSEKKISRSDAESLEKTLSPETIARLKRIANMSFSINRAVINKAIEHKE
jgi:hypothetical protein